MIEDIYRNKTGIIYFDEESVEVLLGHQSNEDYDSILSSHRYSYDKIYGLSNDEIISKAWKDWEEEFNTLWDKD